MTETLEPTAGKKCRILIIDDHPITREGLANLIQQTEDLTVCGLAADAAESILLVRSSNPDLVLTDISLPDRNGIELIKDFHASDPDLPVVVLSMHDESLYAERALRAGARGYMMKQVSADRLLEGIRDVLAGKIYVSKNASTDLLEGFSSKRGGEPGTLLKKLTDRELEVFRLIGEGLSTAAIGKRLRVSHKTIEAHRVNIKAKLGFQSAGSLISFAARWITADSAGT